MKITLLLCFAIVLVGCDGCSTPGNNGKQTPNSMDSPIIISDGSTHLRHKGAGADFQISPNNGFDQAVVSDPGFSVQTSGNKCDHVVSCPPDFMNNLQPGWTINVQDVNGNPIMTVSSMDNQTITTNFLVSNVGTSVDASNDTNGSDLGQPSVTFQKGTFVKALGANPESIVCNNSGSQRCKMHITYHHN